jgi:hypothetical protein
MRFLCGSLVLIYCFFFYKQIRYLLNEEGKTKQVNLKKNWTNLRLSKTDSSKINGLGNSYLYNKVIKVMNLQSVARVNQANE